MKECKISLHLCSNDYSRRTNVLSSRDVASTPIVTHVKALEIPRAVRRLARLRRRSLASHSPPHLPSQSWCFTAARVASMIALLRKPAYADLLLKVSEPVRRERVACRNIFRRLALSSAKLISSGHHELTTASPLIQQFSVCAGTLPLAINLA